MSTPDPVTVPQPDTSPEAPEAPSTEPGTSAPRHRTHPITPLVTGWKIMVGAIAVITAQNIARLLEDFTLTRALVALGVLAVALVIAVAVSTLSWWFTTYAVDAEGVSLHTGWISRSREFAPRARIESVSVERPLLARLLGLAKVRVEVAGAGDSYLDIEYVRSADAERLRREILTVAQSPEESPGSAPHDLAAGEEQTAAVAGDAQAAQAPRDGAAARMHQVLYDGVTDGELIAQVPTQRLIHSLLRDVGFVIGILAGVGGVLLAIGLAIWQDGFSFALIVPLAPVVIAVPKYVLGRIEAGWGFVSRSTDSGLRMRRGLLNTRTDNIAPGRIQSLELHRPLLWRSPGWTAVNATVAGVAELGEDGDRPVLPVGTREELAATLGHLAAPLGTDDDLATLEHLLTAPARQIDGLRTPVPLYWIARRTEVAVLLPGALLLRSGIFTRRVQIIPRERIQQLSVGDGPLTRRFGVLDLTVEVAGDSAMLTNLARADVLALHATLSRDAATLRRYSDREHWPRPVLAGGPPVPTPPAEMAP